MPAVECFEDLANLSDDEMTAVLREADQKDVVIALKGGSEAVKGKMLRLMSERVRTFILEEMEFLGDVSLGQIEDAQKVIVDIAKTI